ncbi:MAG: type 4a pilus biogenesis protein PilO [Firmicutes bacterium]|nr:type 4a pilus biogenesis protein PilO [Bacillota bacterium]
MRLSRREIGWLGLLVLAVSICLVWRLVYRPLGIQQQGLQMENAQLARELEGMKISATRTREQAQDEPGKRQEYQQMLAKVPTSPMIPDVIDFLELSSLQSEVRLLSITYKEKVELAPTDINAQPINFKIAVKGTHFNLLSLVLKIENAPRLFIVNGIKMTLSKNDGDLTRSASYQVSQEANPNPNSGGEKAVPESQSFNPEAEILELDFNAFYEQTPTNPSPQT